MPTQITRGERMVGKQPNVSAVSWNAAAPWHAEASTVSISATLGKGRGRSLALRAVESLDQRPKDPTRHRCQDKCHYCPDGKDQCRIVDNIFHRVEESGQSAETQGRGNFDDPEKVPFIARRI